MKKILFAIMLLLGVSTMAISCEKDNGGDDGGDGNVPTKSQLIGKWQLYKDIMYENGEVDMEFDLVDTYYNFKSDGTYEFYNSLGKRIGYWELMGGGIAMSDEEKITFKEPNCFFEKFNKKEMVIATYFQGELIEREYLKR